MKKEIKEMSVCELISLKSEIEKEISLRKIQETTCIWGLTMEIDKDHEEKEKSWSGETYIS